LYKAQPQTTKDKVSSETKAKFKNLKSFIDSKAK